MNAPQPKRRLPTYGTIFVTKAAAEDYMRTARVTEGIETARRELTEVAVQGYVTGDDVLVPGVAAQCRARSKAVGVDVTFRATIEGPLVVIVSANARNLNEGR